MIARRRIGYVDPRPHSRDYRGRIAQRKGALRRYQMRQKLRHDTDPADWITTKLMQSLQLAAWAKKHSPDRDEALAYERQCFEFLLQWLGQLERPDIDTLDLPRERQERRPA